MATASAIVPASIIAGVIGTAALMVVYMSAAALAGALSATSLEDLLSFLVVGGAAIAVGSIGGTFVVAFYLVIFGLPVALMLGERVRTPAGLLIAMATGLAAAYVVSRWMWGMPSVSGEPSPWEEALVLLCFVLPAAWFYRRQVIAMLDELPA
ncbi:MAG: hypothetical protein HLUCCX21_03095 [Porphyrobacter sp. HL-46]|nr:MAG: hypothetical protein HLUCCX21_03095 [Porphyrobacter sp. HL-46]